MDAAQAVIIDFSAVIFIECAEYGETGVQGKREIGFARFDLLAMVGSVEPVPLLRSLR
jgi:hypothetical protein